MDRALNRDLIRFALGEQAGLPDPDELISLLAEAEIHMFTGNFRPTADLLRCGWFLHSVASSPLAETLYSADRRRSAYRVAGHIFDMALADATISRDQRLRFSFAAQTAYIGGSLHPNAIGVYRQRVSLPRGLTLVGDFSTVALEVGTAFLGSANNWLYPNLIALQLQARDLEARWATALTRTIFGATVLVTRAVALLLSYQTNGTLEDLASARTMLASAVVSDVSSGDLDARWVAALLLRLAQDMEGSTLWSVLPPWVPKGVRRAFTVAAPPVLVLWPPQVELLSGEKGARFLDPNTRRCFLSLPTSAGKTMMAQLLVAAHLSRAGAGGVCFVAPTRSLCREIRASLNSRLRFIRRGEVRVSNSDELWTTLVHSEAEIQVMTPERLSYLLKADPAAVLDRFGLFVVDEVHTVGDRDRGWTLESALTTLHFLTMATSHRIVVMSAAVGNRAHLRQWLDPGGDGLAFESDWRGPRRVHCIYTAEPNWDHATELRLKNGGVRASHELLGRLTLRTAALGKLHRLTVTDPVGTLVLRQTPTGPKRDQDRSTPFYKTLAPLAAALGRAGPVLIICPTKVEAVRLAVVLAALTGNTAPPGLVDAATTRLGSSHPLVTALQGGVAFHHASLPDDLLLGIEDALVSGSLQFVVATTTLTEGVNLPVRTVIIAGQGAYGAGGAFEEFIRGPRLLNAIGRAGRAARETEGWIVMAQQAKVSDDDFKRFQPTEQEIHVSSAIADSAVLVALAHLEESLRAKLDEVFSFHDPAVAGFLAYIWYVASMSEPTAGEALREIVEGYIRSSLLWVQADEGTRRVLLATARGATRAYEAADATARGRWAKSGLSLSSARLLDGFAAEFATQIAADKMDPAGLFLALLAGGWFERLMSLPEAPTTKFRTYRSAPATHSIDVSHLVPEWLEGVAVSDLAGRFLGDVSDDEYRLEQLGSFLTSAFETYLPWVLALFLGWVDEKLASAEHAPIGAGVQLAAFIRYGVDSPQAIEIMRAGVADRDLARRIASSHAASDGDQDLRLWLCSLQLEEWNERFQPAIHDLRALLDLARRPGSSTLADILEGEKAQFEITVSEARLEEALSINFVRTPLGAIHLTAGDRTIASVRPDHVSDLDALLRAGVPLRGEIVSSEGTARLDVYLTPLASA